MKTPASLLRVPWSTAGAPVILATHSHLQAQGPGLSAPLALSALSSLVIQGGLIANTHKLDVQKCFDIAK